MSIYVTKPTGPGRFRIVRVGSGKSQVLKGHRTPDTHHRVRETSSSAPLYADRSDSVKVKKMPLPIAAAATAARAAPAVAGRTASVARARPVVHRVRGPLPPKGGDAPKFRSRLGQGLDGRVHEGKTSALANKISNGLQNLWDAHSSLSTVLDLANKHLPQAGHEISVSAVGGPQADLRRVWYLACSAAFGRYRYRTGDMLAYTFHLECVWDVSHKAVGIKVRYGCKGLTQFDLPPLAREDDLAGNWIIPGVRETRFDKVVSAIRPGGALGVLHLMHEGPDQVTIGNTWPYIASPNDEGVANNYTPQASAMYDLIQDKNLVARFSGPRKVNPLGEIRYKTLGDEVPRTSFGNLRTFVVGDTAATILKLPHGQIQDISAIVGIAGAPPVSQYLTNPTSDRATGTLGRETFGLAKSGLPGLPDNNRVITTGEKRSPLIQPPKPQLDGISRSSLIDLFTAALHDPCTPFKAVKQSAFLGNGHHLMRLADFKTKLPRKEDWLKESVDLLKASENVAATSANTEALKQQVERFAAFAGEI